MTPEHRPIRVVKVLERAVLFLQPLAESRLAQLAVAVSAVLVRNVPQNHRRMPAEPLRQGAVHLRNLLTVDRRGQAVVVALGEKNAASVRVDAKHFGIFLRHPAGARARRRGQHGINPLRVEIVDNLREPVELIAALLRLKTLPVEDADAHGVAARKLHQTDILLENIRSVQPLARIVVAAVKQHIPIFHCSFLPFGHPAPHGQGHILLCL